MDTFYRDRLRQVHDRIHAACQGCGRPDSSVTLLAVSKTFGIDAVQAAHAAGQTAFGENYILEAIAKITALSSLAMSPPLQWHCIGPVQSNKTRLVAEHFDWVHTLDRLKIAERLSAQRPLHLGPLQVCIQVNVDGSPSKAGVPPSEALALAQAVAALPHLQLRGVMSIPDAAIDFEANYAVLMRIRAVFDALNAAGLGLDTLSMGMSADLEAAITAGSTLVRVGSAIFGQRPPHQPVCAA